MRGAKTLIGPAATREGLFDEVTRHSILHLATHCRIVPDVPFLSAVSLANGKEFSILDLLDQHLNLELVVLSACQTGWGAAASGEDLVGFSRAFLAAGARAVLVSLWRVDDLATCQLFVKFYEALRCDLEPAEALHRAQLSLQGYDLTSEGAVRDITPEKRGRVADYSLPAYWAPFTLISA
jgi:CHAT domain-containing protein